MEEHAREATVPCTQVRRLRGRPKREQQAAPYERFCPHAWG
jgi:hypothetical protein